MANYLKRIDDTTARFGEGRFSYANVLTPRGQDDGRGGLSMKYSTAFLIPKKDTEAIKLFNAIIEAAKAKGIEKGTFNKGTVITSPLHDGDVEKPDDPIYAGMMYFNAKCDAERRKPGVKVRDTDGKIRDAFDDNDFYSGCWGCITIGAYAYNRNGNKGVGIGLNNVIKTRDDDKLSGAASAEADFGDLGELEDDDILG
jgi:hypothetical protein